MAKVREDDFTKTAKEFMESYGVPGLSVAFAHKGKMKRVEAFGEASVGVPLETSHMFRIASISKPITAAGIFTLIEKKKLKLDDLVFGESGILDYGGPKKITIQHLLNHTCGGWPNDEEDPTFKHLDYDHDELIKWTLKNTSLDEQPGKQYSYSNFGYCLLGRVIEKVTGETYADYIQEAVLSRCDIDKMQVGEIKLSDNEVQYFDSNRKEITFPMNIPRMDSHGGWIGTPTDMVKFGLCVDVSSRTKDILSRKSLRKMLDREGVEKSYACGWNINEVGNYWHTGSLPGLASILVVTKSDYCWSACVNTRTEGIDLALDQTMWDLKKHL